MPVGASPFGVAPYGGRKAKNVPVENAWDDSDEEESEVRSEDDVPKVSFLKSLFVISPQHSAASYTPSS
jgi:hypothetical protein